MDGTLIIQFQRWRKRWTRTLVLAGRAAGAKTHWRATMVKPGEASEGSLAPPSYEITLEDGNNTIPALVTWPNHVPTLIRTDTGQRLGTVKTLRTVYA
ncbi:MAG: hypothetical protein COT81_04165 [Candidatus Buchananbacteria bacterium CG10_big_fil_rev_8_21_14_0_10_42_9]|uniref:Uncharacterized protein n=1 Tax=Candidatus Buchananbacteria bacterium CG10_big_fil_rev_8_21_14_0_10_42_9 TaxID=1974526 RepID=A0A2H0W0D7_9BACT|nr:MAG: hypothetical protein COT81_04165 [Candidatus Buchananbacteria bacterium CG10_big_fil_rev_8_21_14_0_10_42_9]